MFNNEVNQMFIKEFITMIIDEIGKKNYDSMINQIGLYKTTDEDITVFKNKVSNYLVDNGFCAF